MTTSLAHDPAARVKRDATRRRNLRLALILATIAIAFFAGIVAKAMLFGL